MVVLEALGLALGVAPLLIEILKANPEPLDAMKALKSENAKEMMSDFVRDLQFEVSMFKLTLTALVKELHISTELKDKLIEEKTLDPMVWKVPTPELEMSLRKRLEPCFESFKQSMEQILRLLTKLVDKSDLPPPLSADKIRVCMETPYEKLEVFLDTQYGKRKRLRLGWKQKERDFIMRGITKHNKRLDGMLKRTAETRTDVTPTQHWATTSCIPHIGLRQKMSDLRDAIAKAWCTCVENHELRFGLSKMWKDSDNVKMDMIMNMSQDGENWHWAESKIQIRLKDSPPPTIVESPSDHRRRSSSSFSGTTLAGSPIRETAYEYTNTTTSRKTSINEVIVIKQMTDSAKASRRYSGSRHDGTFVEDICRIVQKGQKARRASQLQFYQDKLWHYTTTTASEVHYSEPGIRLDQFLQKGKMTMKDRKILQVLLAQSVLFFPWVGQDLNKTSIVFHHDLNKPFATLMIDREDPATHQVQSSLTTDSNDSQYKPYNNETLAALATTLFEIEFERTIERFRIPDDVTDGDSSNFDTDFWTLTRVLKDEKDNMYLGIYEAIHSCISCDFEPDLPPQLDNPGFLQHVYERIVAPLEQELLRAFSITMPFFDDPGSPIKTSTKIVNFQ